MFTRSKGNVQNESGKILKTHKNYEIKRKRAQLKHKLASPNSSKYDVMEKLSDIQRCSFELQKFITTLIDEEIQESYEINPDVIGQSLEIYNKNSIYGGTVRTLVDINQEDWICEYPGKFKNINSLSAEAKEEFKNIFWMFKVGETAKQYFSFKVESSAAQAIAGSCEKCANVELQMREKSGVQKIWVQAIKRIKAGDLLWISYGLNYWTKISDCSNPKCPICDVSLMVVP